MSDSGQHGLRLAAASTVVALLATLLTGTYLASPALASPPPNDPLYSRQWPLQKLDAGGAWDFATTGDGVDVAVIDTGVDLQHEDLQCPGKLRLVPNADFVLDGDGVDDHHGHGTHVAGIIGACTNNGIGMAGIAPDATIVPYQVLDAQGQGNFTAIARAISFAVDKGAHIINLSLTPEIGPVSYVPGIFSEVENALEFARAKGVVVVAAAGNDALPICEYPGLAEDVICVGATDSRDLKAWYSTFPVKVEGTEPGPAMVAPGGLGVLSCGEAAEAIISAAPTEKDECDEGTLGYQSRSGTSMAAAFVAGVAALLYEKRGASRTVDNADMIVDALLDTANDLGPDGYDPVFGYGRLTAHDAVAAIPRATLQPTATPPTPSDVEAYAVEKNQIDLEWSDESQLQNAADGYAIERSWSSGAWTEVARVSRPHNRAWVLFSDAGLFEGTEFFYRVRAFNSQGFSGYSEVVSATTGAWNCDCWDPVGTFVNRVVAAGQAERTSDLIVTYTCAAASAFNPFNLAGAAVPPRISECYVEDRTTGSRSEPIKPRRANLVVETILLDGQSSSFQSNVWVCWRASNNFPSHDVVQTTGCAQAY